MGFSSWGILEICSSLTAETNCREVYSLNNGFGKWTRQWSFWWNVAKQGVWSQRRGSWFFFQISNGYPGVNLDVHKLIWIGLQSLKFGWIIKPGKLHQLIDLSICFGSSRSLVKKQLTWFRSDQHDDVKQFHWIDASRPMVKGSLSTTAWMFQGFLWTRNDTCVLSKSVTPDLGTRKEKHWIWGSRRAPGKCQSLEICHFNEFRIRSSLKHAGKLYYYSLYLMQSIVNWSGSWHTRACCLNSCAGPDIECFMEGISATAWLPLWIEWKWCSERR